MPRPVTSAGSRPISAAVSALAAVVLPMPISPTATTSTPRSSSPRATAWPLAIARSASARVIAGPSVMSLVGRPTPTSTTLSSAPIARASTLTAAPPARMFATIWAVTSPGYAETPRDATP